jgi:archaellum biogenesis protein FlaJ (TadC family)
MDLKQVMRFTVIFSGCFLGASLLITLAFIRGLLSPRGLGIALLVLVLTEAALFVRMVRRVASRSRLHHDPHSADDAERKRRLLYIRLGKLALLLLFLLLINGLFKLRDGPLMPLLVGIAMNVLVTFAVARTVMRLQSSLKADTRPES